MLSLPLPVRVYLCLEPTDMRRSFDGLCRMVREHVGADPLSGDLFVFRSKRGDRVKLLYWLGTGWRSGIGVWRKGRSCFRNWRRVRDCRGRVRWASRGWRFAAPIWPCCWTAWTWPASSGRNAINDQRQRPPRPQTIHGDGTSLFFQKNLLVAPTLSGPWGFILHEHGRNDTSVLFIHTGFTVGVANGNRLRSRQTSRRHHASEADDCRVAGGAQA